MDTFRFQRMERLRLVDHILQRNRVRDELIVNNGFLLISRVIGSKETIPTER